jgi:hypothetical protein
MYAYYHILAARPSPRVAHAINKAVTMTHIQAWFFGHKQLLDPRPIITHHKHLTIKNNLYNSKPMAIFPHEIVYHVIRYNLVFTVFYMHAFIISLFHYPTINHTFSQSQVHSSQSTFHVSYKHAFFCTQNNHAMQKNNKNNYLCEFYSLVSQGSSKKS